MSNLNDQIYELSERLRKNLDYQPPRQLVINDSDEENDEGEKSDVVKGTSSDLLES
jgi:hypothetical protein